MSFARNAWYVAAHASEVGEGILGRQIVGERVMMTRDKGGKVRVLNDRCPHRFAPLHLGERRGDAVMCPYHGLEFSIETGVCTRNPHGDGHIPSAARVKSYAVVERDRMVWLWPGDPELANPDDIPDLGLYYYDDFEAVNGHIIMPVDYRLVLDNLLDLSHAQYIHAGTLSPPAAEAKREIKNEIGERSVKVIASMLNCPTPSSQAPYYSGERGDFRSTMEWVFPGTMRHQLTMSNSGADPMSGAVSRLAHLITPETETSTHYFWVHTRNENTLPFDEKINTKIKEIITYAFVNEDEPIMTACQDYMDGQEFFSLRPLYLATDNAGTRCRRTMERLIAEEQTADGSSPVQVPEKEPA